jgi:hypothetical protein
LNDDGSKDAQFDFRFDGADPPVALEVTQIGDDPFTETAAVARLVVEELRRIVVAESLGHWRVEVVAGTRLKPIKDAILLYIRGMTSQAPYGVESIEKEGNDDSHLSIVTHSSTRPVTLGGFSWELVWAIEQNRKKLALAKGYERHLAIDLKGLYARDPGYTAVPKRELHNSGISVLWVVKTWRTVARPEPVVWWSTGEGWQTTPNAWD